MTFLFVYTVLMAVLSIINGVFTYKIFKQLEIGDNMGKNKKASFGISKRGADKLFDNIFRKDQITIKDDGDNLVVKEEFDGSFLNPFADRELSYLTTPQQFKVGPVEILPKPGEGLSYVFDKDINHNIVHNEESKPSQENHTNGGNVNIPIITNDEEMPEDESSILSRLLYLSAFLNEQHKVSSYLSPEEFENMKWETINETYCLITVDLPRKQAELIRKYFRRLDTTYVKQDGTYYSKVTKGNVAEEVIKELIEVYPWNDSNEDKVRVNWDDFRKINTNQINTVTSENNPVFPPENVDSAYGEKLKYAIGNLSKSVEKLNEILSGK